MIQLVTRHVESFDIHAAFVDPHKSRFTAECPDYAAKVLNFYRKIGVQSAIWTIPADMRRPMTREPGQDIEYLLEVSAGRIVAYVDENTWEDHLFRGAEDFEFSTTPKEYRFTSILVATPMQPGEVKQTIPLKPRRSAESPRP